MAERSSTADDRCFLSVAAAAREIGGGARKQVAQEVALAMAQRIPRDLDWTDERASTFSL